MRDPTNKPAAGHLREIKRCPTCEQRFSRDAAFCPFDGVPLELAAFDPFSDALIGACVDGRYGVVSILGEGGMGRIYEVRHTSLDRAFAMKVLRPELARDPELAARFMREAKTTASVKHPNVVAITDFGRLPDGVPYFVMELLVGYTLGDVIKRGGPIPAARGIRVARQVAAALGAAHDAGVVHRDLKPDNVFLVGSSAGGDIDQRRALALLDGEVDVRVVDFGAAKVVGASRMTRAGVVFGTPHYMSPEQASGQVVDHRADVYALGVILYEMFAGRVPFEADTYMGVLTQHMFVTPVPPSQVPGASPELGALEEVILRCLAKKADERFASMVELVRALDQAVRIGAGSVRPARQVEGSGWASRSSVRPRMADELELPSLAEMRVATENEPPGEGLRGAFGGRGAWGWAAAGVALVGATLGAVLVVHAQGQRRDVAPAATTQAGRTELSPQTALQVQAPQPAQAVPTASVVRTAQVTDAPSSPANESTVGLAPAPLPTVVSPTGWPAANGPRAAPRPPLPRPATPRTSAEMDDVGDPFAGRR